MHLVKMSWQYYQQGHCNFRARRDPGKAPKKTKSILYEDLTRMFESSGEEPPEQP